MHEPERWEFVYDQINGRYTPGIWDGVKNEMAAGYGLLRPFLEQARLARNRLCKRTGLDPHEDPDIELLTNGYEKLARACARLMYQYGWADGQAGRAEPPPDPPAEMLQGD